MQYVWGAHLSVGYFLRGAAGNVVTFAGIVWKVRKCCKNKTVTWRKSHQSNTRMMHEVVQQLASSIKPSTITLIHIPEYMYYVHTHLLDISYRQRCTFNCIEEDKEDSMSDMNVTFQTLVSRTNSPARSLRVFIAE